MKASRWLQSKNIGTYALFWSTIIIISMTHRVWYCIRRRVIDRIIEMIDENRQSGRTKYNII